MLSMSEIIELLAKNEIIIKPLLDPKEQIQGASVDIRLGSHFKIFRRRNITHLKLENPEIIEEELARGVEDVIIGKPPDKIILHPGDFALASTLEYIRLPPYIVAEIHGKSSWARLGLMVHSIAGFVDPGFSGTLTLELINVGKLPIPLYVGVRIAQLTFHRLNHNVPKYGGKYGGFDVKLSKIYEYYEFEKISKAERKASP